MDSAESEIEPGETPTENSLVPKRSSTSVIWHYFGFDITDVQQKKVLCKTCRRIVATSRGNTTNLRQHLKKHHGHLYEECLVKTGEKQNTTSDDARAQSTSKQTTLHDSFASVTPYETSSRRHRELTESVTFHLAKDMAPINTVTKTGFKRMLRKFDRRYQMPSRTYFGQVAVPEMYKQCRKDVLAEMNTVDYYAATTVLII